MSEHARSDQVKPHVSRRNLLKGALASSAVLLNNSFYAQGDQAELILTNGRVTTLDPRRPSASAVAIAGGRIAALGSVREVMGWRGPDTEVIDLGGRTVIPGLNDSHTHVIRGGLNYNLELRWDGVPSLADALALLRQQAARTPPPQWVRIIGGWSEFQFAERRMPTLDEINAAAPDTPVFILHLYLRALLNRAALRALGITRNTPNPPGGLIQRDTQGNPTGMLIAEPNALILYSTIARAPRLSFDDQLNSTRHFMRELNRLGVTSVIDAGGGGQNYPEDYAVIQALAERDQLTVRIAYNLFAQEPGAELANYTRWTGMTSPGEGNDFLRMNGAGENLVWSAADFENFLEPRPDLEPIMERELGAVVRLLLENRWPFRLHATYDETIGRFLDLFERIHQEVPFDGLRWVIDHAETVSERNIERIRALGGGIAVQHRMAFQGEYFISRYGAAAAARTPPIASMLAAEVPVGAGTDATRVASYNPWVGLYWLVSGRTVGSTPLYPAANRLSRTEALRRYTLGSAWFSGEETLKGSLEVGKAADLAVLSDDYFSVSEEAVKRLQSVLTVVAGRTVYAAEAFTPYGPAPLPVSPDWSPVALYNAQLAESHAPGACRHPHTVLGDRGLWAFGCDCFVG